MSKLFFYCLKPVYFSIKQSREYSDTNKAPFICCQTTVTNGITIRQTHKVEDDLFLDPALVYPP